MQKVLRFIRTDNPPTLDELQVTVRVGEKWRYSYDNQNSHPMAYVSICDEPHLGDCGDDCERLGIADFKGEWFGILGNIPAAVIEREHEPGCQTFSGLRQRLQEVYGSDVGNQTFVTALTFRVRVGGLD